MPPCASEHAVAPRASEDRLLTRDLCRLARRALWRKRKLWVHARENKAAISIQCAIRVYLARKNMQRQVSFVRRLLLWSSLSA